MLVDIETFDSNPSHHNLQNNDISNTRLQKTPKTLHRIFHIMRLQHIFRTFGFLFLQLIFLTILCSRSHATEQPNLIVIMTDDMGYGDAGCYGGTLYPTPHINRLAKEGMRFTDFHSSGAVCSPTRAGLLTGRYQQRAGVDGVIYAALNRNRHHGLQHQELTFAEILKGAGYNTAMFGKWHLGYEEQYNPIYQGFDRYVGYVSGNVDFHSHIDGAGVFDWWHQNKHNREKGYTTHLITQHAIDFIRRNKKGPFCLYIAHEAPHDPYQGPNDPPVREAGKNGLLYDHREPNHALRAYREMMTEMDKGVGQIIDTLEELGLEKNTFIMFFSDNGATGPGSCGSLYGMKGTLWEGGHRVPGIAWWPGKIKGSTVTDQLAYTIDVMPTLLELAGATTQSNHPLDGESLAPVLFQNETIKNRKLFWKYGKALSMRDGDWKLVVNGGKPNRNSERFPNINWSRPNDGRDTVALFNLQNDRDETRNVAERYPMRVKAMQKALETWQHDVTSHATPQPEKKNNPNSESRNSKQIQIQ